MGSGGDSYDDVDGSSPVLQTFLADFSINVFSAGNLESLGSGRKKGEGEMRGRGT
jgi:hypothetical protein